MRSLGEAIIQYDWYPYIKDKLETDTHTQSKHSVNMQVEVRVMPLHAQEHQRFPANPPKLGDRHRTDASSKPREGVNHADILILDLQFLET